MNMNMNMNMKASTKKMKGFMCQSRAATAVVCMTGDHQSVIVPRRPDRTLVDHHHARLMKNTKYIRLGDRRWNNPNIAPAAAAAASKMIRSTGHNNNNNTIPSLRRKSTTTGCEDGDDHKKQIQNIPQLGSSNPRFEVVVMRVSLHCQGCAGKLKKHLSKMEGVTSFSIDLETKRVTVMGHVSPVSVLENISKVRRAEFWPC